MVRFLDRAALGGGQVPGYVPPPAPDLTIRLLMPLVAVTAGSGSAPTVLRYYETRRSRLVITNPAGSVGTVVLYTKAPDTAGSNLALNTTTNLTVLATLAPGDSLPVTGPNPIFARSSLATVPAGLAVQIAVDLTQPSGVVTSTTASTMKRYTLANQQWLADAGLVAMGEDRRTFYSATPGSNRQLRVSTNYDTAGASATWALNTTQVSGTQGIEGIVELPDGEILILSRDFTEMNVQRTTGWATNPATATYSTPFKSRGGTVGGGTYFGHQWSAGSNGIVFFGDMGSQNSNSADNGATRAYLSTDYGRNFAQVLNVFDYAAAKGVAANGVHLHAVAYDEAWDRLWVIFGDDNGTGLSIAGAGNIQVLYSDDRGSTWQALAAPDTWSSPTTGYGQRYGIVIGKDSIAFTADVSTPIGIQVYRRLGYRQLGNAETIFPHLGLNSRATRAGAAANPMGYAFGGTTASASAAGTYSAQIVLSPDLLNFQAMNISVTTTASGLVGFFRVFGPTINGKMVAVFRPASKPADPILVGDLTYG